MLILQYAHANKIHLRNICNRELKKYTNFIQVRIYSMHLRCSIVNNVTNYTLLRCKNFGLKIWWRKKLEKYYVWNLAFEKFKNGRKIQKKCNLNLPYASMARV